MVPTRDEILTTPNSHHINKPSMFNDPVEQAIQTCAEMRDRYDLSSLSGLIETCRNAAAARDINIAVLGRFKAGKSSFLNHLIGRDILPVGVIPVTAIVTEIAYGPSEIAEVHHLDGRVRKVPLRAVRDYVSERENPENVKGVQFLSIHLPELVRFRGLRFVDTPGLDSIHAHNTQAARDWLPNVGLALVAVSVDPPLSEQDIALIEELYKFTPNVTLLVTKTDLFGATERREVLDFIHQQLAKREGAKPRVLPYTTRAGGDEARREVEDLIDGTLASLGEERRRIVSRKVDTLLAECESYLKLALRSAQAADSERDDLARLVRSEREAVADVKAQYKLLVQHTAGAVRSQFAAALEKHQPGLEKEMAAGIRAEFPKWASSLANAMQLYEEWLDRELHRRLSRISEEQAPQFTAPLGKTAKQIEHSLQAYRDRLSNQTERAFGVPLHTTETEINAEAPEHPDVRIGRVFDRNWELLSPVLPMWLIRKLVYRHFQSKLPFMIYKNLSRLATQWEQNVTAALYQIRTEADRRLDELIATVERLLATGASGADELQRDLLLVQSLRAKANGSRDHA